MQHTHTRTPMAWLPAAGTAAVLLVSPPALAMQAPPCPIPPTPLLFATQQTKAARITQQCMPAPLLTASVAPTIEEAAGALAEKAGELQDKASGRAGEAASRAAEKAGELQDKASGRAGEAASRAAEKAGELQDKASGRASEAASRAAEKAGELQDKAVDSTREAADALREVTKKAADGTKKATSEGTQRVKEAASKATGDVHGAVQAAAPQGVLPTVALPNRVSNARAPVSGSGAATGAALFAAGLLGLGVLTYNRVRSNNNSSKQSSKRR